MCGGAVALNRHDHASGRLGDALAVHRDDRRGEGAGSLDTGGAMNVGAEKFLRRLYDLKYLVGDKWTLAILVTLSDGPMRRVEILSTINSYSIGEEWSDKHAILHDSMLARTLKKMTEEGLLTRTRRTEIFPPQVFYSLKQDAVEFLQLCEPAIAWAEEHTELIEHAQAYSRQRGRDVGTLTGIAELDDGALDDEDEDD